MTGDRVRVRSNGFRRVAGDTRVSIRGAFSFRWEINERHSAPTSFDKRPVVGRPCSTVRVRFPCFPPPRSRMAAVNYNRDRRRLFGPRGKPVGADKRAPPGNGYDARSRRNHGHRSSTDRGRAAAYMPGFHSGGHRDYTFGFFFFFWERGDTLFGRQLLEYYKTLHRRSNKKLDSVFKEF